MRRNMLRTGTKRVALSCGAAALTLVLAGCDLGGSSDNAASPKVPTFPSSPSTSEPAPPSSTAPPTSTTPPAPSEPPGSVAGNEPASPPGECQVEDLTLSLSHGDSATGTTYRSLRFTNSGNRICTIQGFPGVSYVAGDDGHQVGPAAYREGTKGPPVTLEPGMVAYADVGFVQVRNYEPAACQPTEVRGLRVYPPHEYDSMFVPAPGTGCTVTPPGNQLTVKTVRPGTGLS